MEEYQTRVIIERDKLEVSIRKLLEFMETETYTEAHPRDQALLDEQLQIMNEYDRVLTERIKSFTL